MDYQNILYTKDGPVVILTLNRPDALNAISPALEQDWQLFKDAPFRPEPFGPKSKKD